MRVVGVPLFASNCRSALGDSLEALVNLRFLTSENSATNTSHLRNNRLHDLQIPRSFSRAWADLAIDRNRRVAPQVGSAAGQDEYVGDRVDVGALLETFPETLPPVALVQPLAQHAAGRGSAADHDPNLRVCMPLRSFAEARGRDGGGCGWVMRGVLCGCRIGSMIGPDFCCDARLDVWAVRNRRIRRRGGLELGICFGPVG